MFSIRASIFLSILTVAIDRTIGETPTCTDGGQLYCCQATFAGHNAAVVAAADLACYDLTPADVNCIITDAPSLPDSGCVGTYSCCQVSDLAPLVGLFCSKPPGDCRDQEGNGHCLDLVDGRFGNCSAADVAEMRKDLGLS